MTNPTLCTLLFAILFNVQSISGRSMQRWEQADKLGQEKTTNTFWNVKLMLVIPNIVSNCNGILVETPKIKESGLSDTVLMNPACFGLDYVREGPYYVADPDKHAVAFIEEDSNGIETGRTDVINVSRILIHPKYHHDGYGLAVVRLAKPVKASDNLKPAVLSHFALTEVAECSYAGWTREFNVSIHSDEMELADVDRNEYITLNRSKVSLSETEIANDENLTIVANTPSLASNKLFFTETCVPLICWKDGQQLVQGLVVRKESEAIFSARYIYDNDKTIYFLNVATHYQWIIDAIESSNVPIAFHNQLDEYESKMKHGYALSAGSTLKDKTYEETWHNDLYNKIDVKSNKIAFDDDQDQRQIWNATIEENSYDCAISCYLQNNGNPCSYSKQSKECFFASKVVEPTSISRKVITIYFKGEIENFE